MAPLRALLLLLVAVSAACAARVPLDKVDLSIQRAAVALDEQINDIQDQGVIKGTVEKGLEKLKQLAKAIGKKVEAAEEKLAAQLKKSSEAAAAQLNNLIKKATHDKVDLHLDDNWKDFEAKTAKCADGLKAELKSVLQAIKSEAATCTATQLSQATSVSKELLQLSSILEIVPTRAIKEIKACSPAPEPAPEPVPDTPAPAPVEPVEGSDEDSDEDSDEGFVDEDPATLWPEELDNQLAVDVAVASAIGDLEVQPAGIFDVIEKTQCIGSALWKAAEDLKPLPALVYDLSQDVTKLANKQTLAAVKECVAKATDGKVTALQKSAAEVAYCIIAPAGDEKKQ